jgi:hypothetical protein
MAVAFSDYTKNNLLDWWYRNQTWSVPTTMYWRLFTANPNWATGVGGTEHTGTGYTQYGNDCTCATFWTVASQGANGGYRMTNTGTSGGTDVSWTAGSDWAAITGVGLYDSNLVGGNLILGGAFSADPGNGDTIRISSGAIDIDFDVTTKAGIISYVIEQMLKKLANLTPGSPPTTQYVALYTTAPDIKDGSGSAEVSVTGTAYARTSLTPASGWDAASGGAIQNAAQIDYTLATASWGTVVGAAIVDTASGAPTHYHAVDAFTGVVMDSGDDFYIADGAFDIAFTDTV